MGADMLRLILLLFFPDPELLTHRDYHTRQATTLALTHPVALLLLSKPPENPEAEWRRRHIWHKVAMRYEWVVDAVEVARFLASSSRFMSDPDTWLDRVDRLKLFQHHGGSEDPITGEWVYKKVSARRWVYEIWPTQLPQDYLFVEKEAHTTLLQRMRHNARILP